MIKEEFINEASTTYSWWKLIYTHAWHESNNFRRVIGNYNFWGIKKPNNWRGKVVSVNTHEYINNVKTKTKELFIDFETCKEAIEWYVSLIKRLYPESYKNINNPMLYFSGLISGKYKYATDPKYVAKLQKLYRELNP